MIRVSFPSWLTALVAAMLFCFHAPLRAVDAGVLDTSFVPLLFNGGEVLVATRAAGGQLYIGGDFDWVSGQPADWLVRVNADGSVDPAFNPTKPVNASSLLALGVQADGKVLVGYFFQLLFYPLAETAPAPTISSSVVVVGPTPVVSPVLPTAGIIIRLNTDGSVDSTFNEVDLGEAFGNQNTNVLRFIQPMASGKILIGGGFSSVNGTSLKHLAQLNADGTVDTSFKTTVNGDVADALRASDGTTLIGGSFTAINGTKIPFGLARLNANGSRDAKFLARGKAKAAAVTKIAPGMGGGILIATSSQQTLKSGVVNNWSNLEAVGGAGVYQKALATNVSGHAVDVALLGSGVAVLVSATGSETQTVSTAKPLAPGLAVFCSLAAVPNIKMAAPQTVSLPFHPNGLVTTASGLAGFGSSGGGAGSTPSGFGQVHRPGDPAAGLFKGWVGKTATVDHVAASGSGLLVAGGFDFGVTSDGTVVDRGGLARLQSDGSVDPVFAPAATTVTAMVADADGGATIIGTTSPGTGTIVPLASSVTDLFNNQSLFRLTASGVLDTTFATSEQPNATVLVAQADGGLVVGGWGGFDEGGVVLTPGSVTPLTSSGASAGTVVIGPISPIVQPVQNHAPLARYLSTGVLDTGFAPVITGTATDIPLAPVAIANDAGTTVATTLGSITDVTLDIDGSLLITGNFTQVNGTASPGIARLFTDGTLDTGSLFTAVPSGFTHVLPRAGGYLVTAPSLWNGVGPIAEPGLAGGVSSAPVSNLIIVGPIFGPGSGGPTISPFLGTLPTGAADSTFSVAGLTAVRTGIFGNPSYGVKFIDPNPAGGWVALTRDLNDSTTNSPVSLVEIGADGSVNDSFAAPVFGSNPSPLGGAYFFWWGVSQPADYVNSMAVLGDGSVIVGGTFWSVNGEARSGLAKLNLNPVK